MSIISGKKYIVISPEDYDILKQHQTAVHEKQPERSDMEKSSNEMKNIWNRNMEADEKVHIYTEELNNFKSRYNDLIAPMEVKIKNNTDTSSIKRENKFSLDESIVNSLPKSSKTHAKRLIDYLKTHPEIINWNDKGEIMYHGRLINGSNISDLVMDAMNNRSKSSNLPPFYESIYAKLLADVNVPNDWIKNNKRLNMIHSHKYDEDKKGILATPVKKTKWASST